MAKIDTPCHNCSDRHEGCHSDCPKYIEYKSQMDQLHKKYSDKVAQERLFKDYVAGRTSKFKK